MTVYFTDTCPLSNTAVPSQSKLYLQRKKLRLFITLKIILYITNELLEMSNWTPLHTTILFGLASCDSLIQISNMPLKLTEIAKIFPVYRHIYKKCYIRLLRSVVRMCLAAIRSSFLRCAVSAGQLESSCSIPFTIC